MTRRLKLLLITNYRQHYGRTFTAHGLREVWTNLKRNSVQPHIEFARYTACYWELRDGCH